MAQDALRIDEVALRAGRKQADRELRDFPAIAERDREDLSRVLACYHACTKNGLDARRALEAATGMLASTEAPQDPGGSSLEDVLDAVRRRPDDAVPLMAGAHQRLRRLSLPAFSVLLPESRYERADLRKPELVGVDAQRDELVWTIEQLMCYSPGRGVNPERDAMPSAILLHGPPGTGKTSLCRYALAEAQELSALTGTPLRHESFSASDYSKWVGESARALRAKYERVADPGGVGVLVVDDIDMILQGRDDPGQSTGMLHVTAELMHALSGVGSVNEGNHLVLATTNRAESIDAALRRRFGAEIAVPTYSSIEQYEALCASLLPDAAPDAARYLSQRSFSERWSCAAVEHTARASRRLARGRVERSVFCAPEDERYASRAEPMPVRVEHVAEALAYRCSE